MRIRTALVASALGAAAAIAPLSGAASAAGALRWVTTPTPSLGTGDNVLAETAGTSGSDVWAVGRYEVKAHYPTYPLAEHWNGTAWTSTPVPVPTGADDVRLNDVVSLGNGNAWAVGSTGTVAGLHTGTYVTHWDGTAWSVVPSPDPAGTTSGVNEFNGVAATGPNDLWAVGTDWTGDQSGTSPLIAHWNGSAWSTVSLPDFGRFTTLQDVAVRSATDVWVVGSATSADPAHRVEPLVLHWDGQAWTRVNTANAGDVGTSLYRVAVGANGAVWATGASEHYTWEGDIESGSAIMRYDGNALQFVTVSSFTRLSGLSVSDVAIAPSGDVWVSGLGLDLNERGVRYSRFNGTAWQDYPDNDADDSSDINATTVAGGQLWGVGDTGSATYAEHSTGL
jgi:hypothetical protein